MKKKVDELEGAELDYWVARSGELSVRWEFDEKQAQGERGRLFYDFDHPRYRNMVFSPSTDWSQGGPIIKRELIDLQPTASGEVWTAKIWDFAKGDPAVEQRGPDPLIAAMRCFVSSKFGEEVEVKPLA